jgi:hypothetical protein
MSDATINRMRAAVLIVLAVTLVRLINLLKTPVFGDEGLYCYLGYQINHLPPKDSTNLILNVWKDAPLLPVLNAAALKLFPGLPPLWVCRAAVTTVSSIGALIIFGLGGWWATLFYLLNPFSFFLDRTILMEPVLNTMMLVYIWLSLKAIASRKFAPSLLAGAAAIVMLMAKQTGILALPIPAILAWANKQKLVGIKNWVITIIIASLLTVLAALQLTKLADTAAMHTTTVLSLSHIKTNLWLIGNWLIQYWTWWVIPVIILGWRWKWALTVAYFILTFTLFGWTLFPRYLLIIVPFVSLSIVPKNMLSKGLLILLLAIFVRRDITILLVPDKAVIAKETRYQFFEDWGSGSGTKIALEWLQAQKFSPQTILLVPQDIQGLWVMSQKSFTPDLNLDTYFYTNDQLISQSALLVATSHQLIPAGTVRLMTTNADNRNSVTIYQLNR